PLLRLVEKQLREAEFGLHPLFLAPQTLDDLAQPFGVGPEHRTAAIDRPAVAVDPHDIDVRRALGDALLEDFRALVDHRVERALDDLLIADLAPLDALLLREILDDLLDHRRRARPPFVVIIVEARALLLAPTVDRAQRVADILDAIGVAVPADVDPGEVSHLERPHRHPEL